MGRLHGRCARCRTVGARCGAGTWARSPSCRPPGPGCAAGSVGSASRPTDEDTAGERLVLAFDELASNALRHGESPVVATVVAGSGGWLLDVSDRAPETMPAPAVDRDPAQGGLGLHLVARLAVAHGWYVDERLQARVGVPARPPSRPASPPSPEHGREALNRSGQNRDGSGPLRFSALRRGYGRTRESEPLP